MQRLVSERIKKLREEIAEISEANRTQMHRRDGGAAADHERRLQRLQEILDELMTLTDWKKTLNSRSRSSYQSFLSDVVVEGGFVGGFVSFPPKLQAQWL